MQESKEKGETSRIQQAFINNRLMREATCTASAATHAVVGGASRPQNWMEGACPVRLMTTSLGSLPLAASAFLLWTVVLKAGAGNRDP